MVGHAAPASALRLSARAAWAVASTSVCAISTSSITTGASWSCYTLGVLVRSPLVIGAECRALAANVAAFAATYRRHVELLGGRLSLLFLGGWPADLVPLTFGERFAAVLYDGVLIDPGSPLMRASLAHHLRRLPPNTVQAVVATHHHEEHVGNLAWAAGETGAPLVLGEATAERVRTAHRLPRVRRWIIGQPEPVTGPINRLEGSLPTRNGRLEVLPAPGHCDDHLVLYDPDARLLLAGDAFMGQYFATPNADVDSVRWIETLERLCALDVEILVEGHGHVRTLRRDIPDVPGVVVRDDPRRSLADKLGFLRWIREQVVSGFDEDLPVRMIEASCFPWGRRRTWESFVGDELARVVSGGEFSRTELVRSFVRAPQGAGVLPTVFELSRRRPTGPAR
jgi:glyoxylase-like metal-dependent hydrolase (beta-lactamase superfamily II)